MSAEGVLQAAVLAALRSDAALSAGLNGVFEGPAAQASAPYAELGELMSVDWGVKDRAGREIRLSVTVRDAGQTSARVQALAEVAGRTILAVPRDLSGWRVAGLVFVRMRVVRGAPGRWAAVIEFRVRMMEVL